MAKHRENKMTTNTFKAVVSGVFLISFGTVFWKTTVLVISSPLTQNALLTIILDPMDLMDDRDGCLCKDSMWLASNLICVSWSIRGDLLFPFSGTGVADPLETMSSSLDASVSLLVFLTPASMSPPGRSASSDPGTCKYYCYVKHLWFLSDDLGWNIIYSGCLVCCPGSGLGIKCKNGV